MSRTSLSWLRLRLVVYRLQCARKGDERQYRRWYCAWRAVRGIFFDLVGAVARVPKCYRIWREPIPAELADPEPDPGR